MRIHSYLDRIRRWAKTASKDRKAGKVRSHLAVEALEDRFVPSTLNLNSGLVTYQAANGEANRLEISLQTTSSGTTNFHFEEKGGVGIQMGTTTSNFFDINASLVTNIKVNLQDKNSPDTKNDTLKVFSTNELINVTGSDGNDTVTVGDNRAGGRGLEDVTAPVVFDGGNQKANGTGDVLVFNDRNAPVVGSGPTATTLNYFVEGGAVTRERVDSSGKSLGFVMHSGTNVEELDVNGSNQSDIYGVDSTLSTTRVVINAGDGDDSVSTLFNMDNLASGVTINGEGGTDNLTINDGLATTARDYVITTGQVSQGTTVVTLGDTMEGGLTLNAGKHDNTIDVQSASAFMPLTLNGGTGSDTVTISDQALKTFQTYTFNAGNLERTVFVPFLPPLPTAHINYSGIDKLVVNAGSGNDEFVLTDTAQPKLEFAGGGGIDEINYSAFTSNVTVNLATGTANKVAKLSNIENAEGGSANDILVGNDQDNTLTGNDGRDLIIGGKGADRLFGGADQDLEIASDTAYDKDDEALSAIRLEWAGTKSEVDRMTDLKTGVGVGGAIKLDDTTVHTLAGSNDDGAADELSGDGGKDWFWANLDAGQDLVTDLSGEYFK